MKGITLDQLPEKYRRQAERQLAGKNSLSSTTSDVEQNTSHALLAKKEIKGFDGQVDVRFIERRHRLADPDGASVKYCLDALVSCGVLRGDGSEEIRSVGKEQVKISKSQPEETIIEILKVK